LSDRIAVMYLGTLVEVGQARHLMEGPLHPYTKCLLFAVPEVGSGDRHLQSLGGEIPSGVNPPSGCPFHPRCPEKILDACRGVEPVLRTVNRNHQVACHLVG
jgi:oligopeptide/dipeptide ABC transporter ATP-binding protein